MKNSVIFIILFLFLGATVFFWFQALKVQELPPATPTTPSSLSGAEATSVINLAMELLIDNREPLPYLSGRDPFSTDDPEAQSKAERAKPHNSFVLSSVVYNDIYSLAVINGEILAEGDIISNEMAEYEYIVENIEVDEVEVSDGEETYTLNLIFESYKKQVDEVNAGKNKVTSVGIIGKLVKTITTDRKDIECYGTLVLEKIYRNGTEGYRKT